MTYLEFNKQFSSEDACLDYLFQQRYADIDACPGCGIIDPRFYRIKSRKCYQCSECMHQIYPMVGTIMEASTTDLVKWFYAIYLFSVSKNGVSAKELERALGVTYRTALRIGHKIRELMQPDNTLLEGTVEVDESLIGGKVRGGKRGWGAENKTCLFGMIERGGEVRVKVIPNRDRETVFAEINNNVSKGTLVYTDEFKAYRTLGDEGYRHDRVVHSRYEWSRGDCSTNSIEGYWSNLKKSIRGTHTRVSPQYLQLYLNEFSFRHNNRKSVNIFRKIIEMACSKGV